MADSPRLKSASALLAVMAGNLVLFYSVLQNESLLTGDWIKIAQRLNSALPAGIGICLTGVLNSQLSADSKARIVFMRWHNPLPGSEAFTKHVYSDSRINVAALRQKVGSFPREARSQNSLWYQLFKTIDTDPAVIDAHKAYLFSRDYTSLSMLLAMVLGPVALYQMSYTRVALGYLLFLAIQFALTRRAACNHGMRFVQTVLALKSAGR